MKTIEIPSVNSERCSTTLKFYERENRTLPWSAEVVTTTPTFKGQVHARFEEDSFQWFIKDLRIIEKERKGECQLVDEWGVSLTIRSFDSLGHFMVKVAMWDSRNSKGSTQSDTLEMSYEIEPSLLERVLNDFLKLR